MISCDCALSIILIACLCCLLSKEVEPEPEITPSVEDTVYDRRQQGKQTPLIMTIKSHFPLSLAYALFRMFTMIRFYRIVEPIPLHDLSSCHSSNKNHNPSR